MLNSRAVVILDISMLLIINLALFRARGDLLFNLGFLLTHGRLIDRHLDNFVFRCHYNGFERRKVCTNIFVVHRPKAVESKTSFVAS
jgi:hypothetical protein